MIAVKEVLFLITHEWDHRSQLGRVAKRPVLLVAMARQLSGTGMARDDLTDRKWAMIVPLLPPERGR